ncbi:MAG: hypothetical protein OQL08_00340 [Gammaproteobacteria bacterium]|nr:hypothetical protein [Gammaproteobacteria bacterium]
MNFTAIFLSLTIFFLSSIPIGLMAMGIGFAPEPEKTIYIYLILVLPLFLAGLFLGYNIKQKKALSKKRRGQFSPCSIRFPLIRTNGVNSNVACSMRELPPHVDACTHVIKLSRL